MMFNFEFIKVYNNLDSKLIVFLVHGCFLSRRSAVRAPRAAHCGGLRRSRRSTALARTQVPATSSSRVTAR